MTADTSVVIPLMVASHDAHADAIAATSDVHRIPAHVLLEAIAVLTRLPAGLAVEAAQAVRVLNGRFPEPPLAIGSPDYADLTSALAAGRMRGGEVYDALIAMTAKSAGAVLLTRDRRAETTYRAIGVESRYLN